ncbi:MAG: 4Fe-4S dicluster domain-containing protein [Proteobacteria bacterium]|jgi:hydrogenase-4 component H|nr:4Fe-4S dicluster domain-containing protein [Pseudomonadota bacterium]
MLKSKLKEAAICFKAGRVTAPFPLGPEPNPPGDWFRGKIKVEVEKCIGCGGCANVCPARLIEINDSETARTLEYFLKRCTYCGRCAEVCPESAIKMSTEYQTATNDNNDLYIRTELYMGTCGRCGRCFKPKSALDKMMVTGFRSKDEAGQSGK